MTSRSLLAVIPKSIPAAKRALAAMERDVDSAKTYEAIRRIERMADAVRLFFHEIEEIRQQAEGVIVIANHRIGRELAPHTRGGNRRSKSPQGTLKDQVGSQKRGVRLKKLATIERSEVKAVIAKLHADGREATVASVLKAVHGDDKAERRAQRERDLATKVRALPSKKYVVIVADPEWQWEPWSHETGMDRAAANHYPTSITPVIAARDVPSIAAKDSVLWLYATIPMLPHAFVVMAAWGFDYVSHYAWGKDKIGPGYWSREKHELILIGTRGQVPCPAPGTQWDSLIMAPRGEHSQKPECFLQMIEEYFPNVPKIELNRRGPPRLGWDAWGLEVEHAEIEVRVDLGRGEAAE